MFHWDGPTEFTFKMNNITYMLSFGTLCLICIQVDISSLMVVVCMRVIVGILICILSWDTGRNTGHVKLYCSDDIILEVTLLHQILVKTLIHRQENFRRIDEPNLPIMWMIMKTIMKVCEQLGRWEKKFLNVKD